MNEHEIMRLATGLEEIQVGKPMANSAKLDSQLRTIGSGLRGLKTRFSAPE
jgi:hypothetical protein